MRPGLEEHGFTMVEMLVTTAILGVVGGVMTTAMIVGFRTTDRTRDRTSESADRQILANYFVTDVESASKVYASGVARTELGTDLTCGGATGLVVQVTWTDETTLGGETVNNVTYASVSDAAGTHLVRKHCMGASATPVDTTTPVQYLANGVAPVLLCDGAACPGNAATPRIVSLRLTGVADSTPYTVAASRRLT